MTFNEPRTYVLVHGAWFGGWVWKETAEALRARGHTVFAPCLTGLGERRHLLSPKVNLTTHADDIIELLEREGLTNVVLVGWSYGGMVISEVLARAADRVGAMIYLDAFVPERGWSALDYTSMLTSSAAATSEQRAAARQVAERNGDLGPSSFEIMGVADQRIIDDVGPRLSPHPIGTFTQPSGALEKRPSHIPHLFVLAGDSPTKALFGPVMERVGREENFRTLVIPTSHLLMLTAPDATLDALCSIEELALSSSM